MVWFFFQHVRKRKEWDMYEPIVDILSNEEVDVLEAREERNTRWLDAVLGIFQNAQVIPWLAKKLD